MKTILSTLALLSLLAYTMEAQAVDSTSTNKITKLQIAAAQYDGRDSYSEAYRFVLNTHLDLVDPLVRNQWSVQWQPANINSSVFKTKQATEKAIKDMTKSLNRKHDSFLSADDTAREKTWLTLKDSVTVSLLKNKIALIKIPSFLPQTVDREAQLALSKCAKAQAIIIDLRGNTGGLVKPALNVAATLIPEGLVYTAKARLDDQLVETKLTLSKTNWITVTSGSSPTTDYSTRTQLAVPASIPMVVLVDGKTASAAEILTGALKQSHRATIIGSRTYGKGTGMKLTFLAGNGRALQVTFEKIYPGGLDTDGVGIQPDVVINQPVGSPTDYQLETATKALSLSIPQDAEPTPPPAKSDYKAKPYGGSPYVRVY